MKCRHCQSKVSLELCNLGFAPVSNGYLSKEALSVKENYYPLRVGVCNSCWLVQTEDYTKADTFFTPDYAYFSSTSSSWVDHSKRYAFSAIKRLGLNAAWRASANGNKALHIGKCF